MDSSEASNAQSFIVKVWVEDTASEGSQGVWRGHITHVPGHQRRYLKHLSEIDDFIEPYLEEMGVIPNIGWRIRRWLKLLAGRER
jgi:hypothetical protein